MRAVPIPAPGGAGPLRSRRLLALAGDERLVEQIRRGNEVAFEVAFERHSPAILGFCRHMLGSQHEAEDAAQQVFVSAYRDLQRDGEREIALKPWLFAIARNRCVSIMRARRERPAGEPGALDTRAAATSEEEVERRAELRHLLADLRELPDEQRAALLLAELADFSHTEIAGVLGCEVPRVKALVYRARTALIAHREARDTPCEQIREQLATLRRGSLRRTELRLHLRDCPGCRAYREQIREQRRMLAAALPVAPSLGLKSSVLAAIGLGGGSAGAGLGGGLLGGGILGGATVAKIAVVSVVAGGGVAAGEAVIERADPAPPRSASTAPAPASAPTATSRPADRDRAMGVGRLMGSLDTERRPTSVGRGRDGGGDGRPAHAGERGRPEHAGQPGMPEHAKGRRNGNGPPAHAGEPGPPAHAKGKGRVKEQGSGPTEPGTRGHANERPANEPKPVRAEKPAKAPKALPAPVAELPEAAPEVVGPGAGKAKGDAKQGTE